jgi:hypothetical protein
MAWRGGVRAWVIATALAVAALTALGIRYGSALSLAVALAIPALPSGDSVAHAEAAREEVEIPTGSGRTLRADLYRPAHESGALLLVHGLSPAGRRHPELVRLAQALAARGQLILVPQFEGLAAFRVSGQEVDDVRAALARLAALSPRPVGIAGLSFGAGPALLAAADAPRLRMAGSFGGYADLRDVLVFITTGVHHLDGRRLRVHQEEYNRWKLLALLVAFVEDGGDRARLQDIAARRLANPADDTGGQEAQLGPEGRAVIALIANRHEEAVPALFAALPLPARQALDALSPLPVMPRLAGRLLIGHGAGDESIPYTESLRLAAAAGPHERALILETFHHVGPRPWWPGPARLRDGWRLLQVADGLLSP